MLTVISLASNNVCSSVAITLNPHLRDLRSPAFVLRCQIVRILVPGFTNVIFLPRIDSEVLPHPFHILEPDVVILAERESDPILRQQNSPEIRMVRILHTEHVIYLAFQPVRRAPNGDNTLD